MTEVKSSGKCYVRALRSYAPEIAKIVPYAVAGHANGWESSSWYWFLRYEGIMEDTWASALRETREGPLLWWWWWWLLFCSLFIINCFSFFFHKKLIYLFPSQRLAPSKSHLDLWVGGAPGYYLYPGIKYLCMIISSFRTEPRQGSPMLLMGLRPQIIACMLFVW